MIGVEAHKHGMAYDRDKGKPKLLPNEPELGFPPVRVILNAGSERVHKASRVKYSELITIEGYTCGTLVGNIDRKDIGFVLKAVYNDWVVRK